MSAGVLVDFDREEALAREWLRRRLRNDQGESRPAGHGLRTGRYAGELARRAGFGTHLAHRLGFAAALHDLGSRRDSIAHPEAGFRLLAGHGIGVLDLAATIARAHHERWDGSGFPRGLAGTAIPLEARITTLACGFDALADDGPAALPRALAVVANESGRRFDPDLVRLLLNGLEDVLAAGRAPEDAPGTDASAGLAPGGAG